MNNIIAKVSAVRTYRSAISSAYYSSKQLAHQQKEDIDKRKMKISSYIKTIDTKKSALQNLSGSIEELVRDYYNRAYEWKLEAQRIYNEGVWVEKRDDSGNVIGRDYKYDEGRYKHALSQSEKYERMLNKAQKLQRDVQESLDYLSNVLSTLRGNHDRITNNDRKYKANIELIETASRKNITKLDSIIAALSSYTASRYFSNPHGSFHVMSSAHSGSHPHRSRMRPMRTVVIQRERFYVNSTEIIQECERVIERDTQGRVHEWLASSYTAHRMKRFRCHADRTKSKTTNTLNYANDEDNSQKLSSATISMESDQTKPPKSNDIPKTSQQTEPPKSEKTQKTGEDIPKTSQQTEPSKSEKTQKTGDNPYIPGIDDISETVSKTELSAAMHVYHGQLIDSIMKCIGCNEFEQLTLDELQKKVCGSKYRYRGYLSASVDEDTAEQHANQHNGVIIDIEIPEGFHMLCVNDKKKSEGINDTYPHGRYVLLPKRTEYQIQSIEKTDDRYSLKVCVISQDCDTVRRK